MPFRLLVAGTASVLAAARAAGASSFVHVGTEAALFVGRDLVAVDESVPLPTHNPFPYGASKAAAERLVLAAHGPEMRTIVLRPRLVWGPRDGSVLPSLLQTVQSGGFWWLDGGGTGPRPVTCSAWSRRWRWRCAARSAGGRSS
jgi:nucleoside-diphosphate-sugar epimerase